MENSDRPRSLALVVGVSALQGLMFWWLSGALIDQVWPATDGLWYTPLLLLAVFVAPVIYVLSTWASLPRTWVLVSLLVLLLVGAGLHQELHLNVLPHDAQNPRVSFAVLFLVTLVFLVHAIPFVQVYLETGHWQPRYSLLFLHAWRNILQLALAGLFAGVFWLLLMLSTALFEMIGIHFPRVLLSGDPRFSLLVVAIAFGVGFHMGGSADRLLVALREQVLSLLKWLALVTAIILVAFTIALLAQAPGLLAEHQHVIRASWLLWLSAITIYLYNAGFQDGQLAEPYPPFAGKLLRFAAPLLILVAGMAFYAIIIRVQAYGLTVPRIWALLVGMLALAYALSYGAAALRRGPWMAGIARANVGAALFLLVALALMSSPLLAPERWAARSIAARLSADPASLSSATLRELRFENGVYGVSRLRLMSGQDASAALRSAAASALAVTEPSAWRNIGAPTIDLAALVFSGYPAGSTVDAGLRERMAATLGLRSGSAECVPAAPCTVLFIDLDGDAAPEAVLLHSGEPRAFRHRGNQWEAIGLQQVEQQARPAAAEKKLENDVQAGRYGTFDPGWKGLAIGDRQWVVVKSR